MNFTLNIYAPDGFTVEKTYKAVGYDLMFGTVRKLMKLIKIDQIDDQVEMIKTIYDAWGEITSVLSVVFPGVTDDEWDNVKVKELLPIIVGIAKYSVSEIMGIPASPN